MRFSITAISLLAAVGSAAPLEKRQTSVKGGTFLDGITSFFGNLGGHTDGGSYPPNSGGTGGFLADLQVPADHIKYTMTPASAEEEIAAAQNSQLREGHRVAHVAIYKGLLGGGK